METKEFTKIYNSEYRATVNYINYKLFRNNEMAEEIAQEVFVKFNKYYDPSRGASPTSFIRTIANTLIIDYIRMKSARVNINLISDYVDSDGNEIFDFVSIDVDPLVNNELKTKIETAFKSLTPKYKIIAELYFIDGLKYDEIAEKISSPINTVKVMIMRCREKLQANLQLV